MAAASPGVRPVRGSATALPLRDGCADLVTSAQSWHWMDPALAIPEFIRVLRHDGVFAAWWNHTHRDSTWEQEQAQRIKAADPNWQQVTGGWGQRGNEFGDYQGLNVATHEFEWQRTITLDRHLDNLVSKSYVAALPDREGFLRTEREIVGAAFPDGLVLERFGTHLVTATAP